MQLEPFKCIKYDINIMLDPKKLVGDCKTPTNGLRCTTVCQNRFGACPKSKGIKTLFYHHNNIYNAILGRSELTCTSDRALSDTLVPGVLMTTVEEPIDQVNLIRSPPTLP